MRIRTSKKSLTVYKPVPVAQGKVVEQRIVSMPLDTTESTIPDEVLDVLSPKDLRAVKAELKRMWIESASEKAQHACTKIAELVRLIESDYLTDADINAVQQASRDLASELKSRARRLSAELPTPLTQPVGNV